MPMTFGIPGRVTVALGLGVTCLVGAGTVVALSMHEAESALQAVRRSEVVHSAVEALRIHVLRAEAAHRTYLMTQKDESLADYTQTSHDIERDIQRLQQLEPDVPGGRAGVDALAARVRRLMAFRGDVLAQHAHEGLEVSRTLVASDLAQSTRAAVDAGLSKIEASERALATSRIDRERRVSRRTARAVLLALLVSLALGFWAVVSLRNERATLARSERRYRALAQGIPEGVFVVSDDRFVYANAAAQALFAAPSLAALLGRSLLSLVNPDDHRLVERLIARADNTELGEPAQLLHVTRLDGAAIELEVRCAATELEGNPAAQFVARDVTLRREAELALLVNEQRLRGVIDGMADGLLLEDASGRVQLWNAAIERQLGLTPEQITGHAALPESFRVYADRTLLPSGHRHHLRLAMATCNPTEGKVIVERAGRGSLCLRVSAVPLCRPGESEPYAVVGTYADVSATEVATRKLVESEARYRWLADNTADLISRHDLDDRFEYASPSHQSVLGWQPDELVGNGVYDYVHTDDVEPLRAAAACADQQQHPTAPVVVRLLCKDGNYTWLELVITAIRGATGDVVGRMVSARDISQRRRLEEQVHRSQKMESMGRMAAAVAHDVNNLLTVIRTSVDLLGDHQPDGRDIMLARHEIVHAVDRAAALTAQLLAFCRRQPDQPSDVPVAPTLRALAGLLGRLLHGGCDLTVTIEPSAEAATVRAARVSLEQVLLNLVSNANDATADSGTIAVACRVEVVADEVSHRFGRVAPGNYVVFVVQDQGTGIPEDVLPNIFEPFFTTKPQGRGTGLGLSTVYGVVQQAQGSVMVDMPAEGGARFTVYWPLQQDSREARSVRPERHPVLDPLPNLRHGESAAPLVMLVEDEESVRRLVTRLLQRFGYRVMSAANGCDGLEILRRQEHAIRAMICDVRMPGMGGIELFRRLTEHGLALPTLFISGQLDATLPELGRRGKAPRLLTKPFTPHDLDRELRSLLAESA